MLMLMEHISVVWMEEHLNLVHNLMIYNCIFMCVFQVFQEACFQDYQMVNIPLMSGLLLLDQLK